MYSSRVYDPRFILNSFDTLAPEAKVTILRGMLDALILADMLWFKANPNGPGVYDTPLTYQAEEIGRDDWRDIPSVLEHKGGDCFPKGTLLLREEGHELVSVEQIRVGDRIWGYRGWTRVEKKWFKGVLPVDVLACNNGSKVTLTGDHHIYVARCPDHAPERDDGYGCSCPVDARKIERVRLREVQPKDVLLQPERLPFGSTEMDPDRALVEGLYVSDGWHEPYRFAISGQDGCPKERQKAEVQAICNRLGVETYWARKYIRVNDPEWAERMALMGTRAAEKHFLSLDLGEGAAAASLRGAMADSNETSGGNVNGGSTFTTTSVRLATEVRVLQKMFGRSCSVATIADHGGLGTHPIHRLGIRDPRSKGTKLLRAKSVERSVWEAPCWDIQTEDHYVYLPEHDVTVSNCEDLACYRVAELRHRHGEPAQPYVTSKLVKSKRYGTFTLYHIRVQRADGSIEDPSKILGMP